MCSLIILLIFLCTFLGLASRYQGKRKEISLSDFTLGLKAIGFSASDEAAKSLFDKLDVNCDGVINYLEWDDYLAVDDLYVFAVFTDTSSVIQFSVRSSLSFLESPLYFRSQEEQASIYWRLAFLYRVRASGILEFDGASRQARSTGRVEAGASKFVPWLVEYIFATCWRLI